MILKADLGNCIRLSVSTLVARTSSETSGTIPVSKSDEKETLFLRQSSTNFGLRVYYKEAFSKVREQFGVSDGVLKEYLGVGSKDFSGGPSKGKSKSFIFFTSGKRFVLKTFNKEEVNKFS